MTALMPDLPCAPCGDFADMPPCHEGDRHRCARIFTAPLLASVLRDRLDSAPDRVLHKIGAPDVFAPRQRKPVLLAVVPWLMGGGGERQMLTLLQGLESRYDCKLVVGQRANADHLSNEFASWTVGVLESEAREARVEALSWYLRGLRPDRVLFYNNDLAVQAAARTPQFRGRLYGIIHTLFGHETALVARTADQVTRFICVSDRVREHLEAQTGAPNLVTIPNGIDPAPIEAAMPAREKLGFSPGDFVIGYLGRFDEGKGLPELCEAFRELHRKDRHYKLLLVGWGDREVSACRNFIGRHGLASACQIRGFTRDVGPYLRSMNCFVLASAAEGGAVPYAVMEAIAAGVPVLCTDVGDVARHLDGHVFMLPEASSKCIVDCVRHISKCTACRITRANSAKSVLLDELSAELMVKRYLEVMA